MISRDSGRIVRFTAASCLAMFAATAARAPAHVRYVHASLIDTATGKVERGTTITVEGDHIEAVTAGAVPPPAPGIRVVDLHGEFVLPGLVNSHVHLATSAEPATARAYLRRELYSGVTTVRDMAGDVRLLAELKREAEFDEMPSPDIFYAALMAGPEFFVDPRTHSASRGREAGAVPWMQAVNAGTDLPAAVAMAKGTGATGIKLYADLSADLVSAVTAEAHRQHLLVWAHAATFPATPGDIAAAGVDVMSHACLLGYEISEPPLTTAESNAHVDGPRVMQPNERIEAVFATMRTHGTILDATVAAYEQPPYKSCLPAESEYLARAAYRAGVPISVGTDDDPDWDHADSEFDTELEMLVEKAGMTAGEVLQSATLIGARTVGEESRIGSLAPGKLANFLVLTRNPLVDIHNVRTVDLVVKHGIRYPRRQYKPYPPEAPVAR